MRVVIKLFFINPKFSFKNIVYSPVGETQISTCHFCIHVYRSLIRTIIFIF